MIALLTDGLDTDDSSALLVGGLWLIELELAIPAELIHHAWIQPPLRASVPIAQHSAQTWIAPPAVAAVVIETRQAQAWIQPVEMAQVVMDEVVVLWEGEED